MATRAQTAARRRNIKLAQAARWSGRHHSLRRHLGVGSGHGENRTERSRAARLGWMHRRARHLRLR